jgi:hypothetical protein
MNQIQIASAARRSKRLPNEDQLIVSGIADVAPRDQLDSIEGSRCVAERRLLEHRRRREKRGLACREPGLPAGVEIVHQKRALVHEKETGHVAFRLIRRGRGGRQSHSPANLAGR